MGEEEVSFEIINSKGGEMATKEHDNWDERIIQKNNTGTYTVSIPIDMMDDLKWRQGQRVLVKRKGKTIYVKDAPDK